MHLRRAFGSNKSHETRNAIKDFAKLSLNYKQKPPKPRQTVWQNKRANASSAGLFFPNAPHACFACIFYLFYLKNLNILLTSLYELFITPWISLKENKI